ncbi:hypothetical protein [Motilibacter deserti]|uniref:Uncharacterized protein n=1 Tax=Motilibacter deserti TaxID=2714956 RepID=A0ABX0GZU1_9ACTN|nr:hypothetical protein [Motilibacter deserti]NHC15240.1 hypothetical protein [Motilibacter deserti]
MSPRTRPAFATAAGCSAPRRTSRPQARPASAAYCAPVPDQHVLARVHYCRYAVPGSRGAGRALPGYPLRV